jgi:hypothetical protein
LRGLGYVFGLFWTRLSLEYYLTGKFSEFMAEIAKKALEKLNTLQVF